jgi:hypothetical protein
MKELGGMREIIDRFIARLDEVVERCTTAIWEAVPAYARVGEDLMEDVRDAVRENVAILSRVLSQGRDVGRDDLEVIERTGARRAEAGIPLQDVLHAYRTVSRECWDILAEECRRQPGDVVEPTIALAEAVMRYTDQLSTTVADAYARAQRAIVREQEGARREFLADLLHKTDASPEDILRRAHTFGYDLSLEYVAMVGSSDSDRNEAAVSSAFSSIAMSVAREPIVLQRGEHTIALFPMDPNIDVVTLPDKLVAELGGDWHFGVGSPQLGLEGIRRSYLEGREALEVGMALNFPGSVYRFSDILMYHFLRIEPAMVDRFVEQTLGPLIEYDERRKGELIKTLEAYFDADGSVKLAGEALFAHPHTVSYRLKQIERLSGWSLKDPEDKLRLRLSLRAYRLQLARPESLAPD